MYRYRWRSRDQAKTEKVNQCLLEAQTAEQEAESLFVNTNSQTDLLEQDQQRFHEQKRAFEGQQIEFDERKLHKLKVNTPSAQAKPNTDARVRIQQWAQSLSNSGQTRHKQTTAFNVLESRTSQLYNTSQRAAKPSVQPVGV